MDKLDTEDIFEYIFSQQIKSNPLLDVYETKMLDVKTFDGRKIRNLYSFKKDQKILFFLEEIKIDEGEIKLNLNYLIYPDEMYPLGLTYNFSRMSNGYPILFRKTR